MDLGPCSVTCAFLAAQPRAHRSLSPPELLEVTPEQSQRHGRHIEKPKASASSGNKRTRDLQPGELGLSLQCPQPNVGFRASLDPLGHEVPVYAKWAGSSLGSAEALKVVVLTQDCEFGLWSLRVLQRELRAPSCRTVPQTPAGQGWGS